MLFVPHSYCGHPQLESPGDPGGGLCSLFKLLPLPPHTLSCQLQPLFTLTAASSIQLVARTTLGGGGTSLLWKLGPCYTVLPEAEFPSCLLFLKQESYVVFSLGVSYFDLRIRNT